MVTLAQLWFKYFEKKIYSEFHIKFSDIENDFTLSPLVYTFLKYKYLVKKKRKVIESSSFYDGNWNDNLKKRWDNLKKEIEKGEDLNGFMSKKNLEWRDNQGHTIIDYLHITTRISHFHLRKCKQGGIGDELIFGVCTDDTFYALFLGTHKDLYDLDKFNDVIENQFKDLNILNEIRCDKKLFKLLANNHNFQPNLIYGKAIPDEYDNEVGLINYCIDGNYYKVPFKVYSAYENEISYIEKLEEFSFKTNGLYLDIDPINKEYIICRKLILEKPQELKRIPFPKNSVLCSTYKQGNIKIVIIDTACANLSSVKFAFDRLGYATEITRDLNKIKSADKLILPGVGTAIAAMKNLQDRGLVEVIQNLTQPVLGICLGMQLMTAFSEEGNVATLSLMPSQTALIPDTGLPLPHMGWNKVRYTPDHPLFAGIEQDSHFYFVHSYAVQPNENTIATSCYGVDFSAAIANKNFYGVQFHPERSGKNGALLLRNFVEKI